LALVGGVDYARNQFNRAIYAKRQSGSAIKPFIYAAALDKGYTPASIILDTPLTYKSDEFDEGWRPKNYENRYFGPTSLRTGLVMSRNVVTVKILKDIGLNYAISYLKQFNMDSQLPRNLSLALGSGVVTPYNLTKAYGTFATYGGLFEPTLIESITTSEGTTLYFKNGENPTPQESVDQSGTLAAAETTTLDSSTLTEENPVQPGIISEQTAYIITNLLADAVREGTAWRVRDLGRPVAGKTGTSDDFKDAWFIGYTPDILCGVWVGYDDMIPLGAQESGAKAAAPLFLDFMQTAVADRPVTDFRVPVGVVFAQVNRKTGLIAANPSADTHFECFKENALPPKEEAATEDLLLKEVF
jgi:penicillin-binding protein 1A